MRIKKRKYLFIFCFVLVLDVRMIIFRRNFCLIMIKLILLLLIFLINNKINCNYEQQPIFTSQPSDVGPLFSGTRGILQCTASGTPSVTYQWIKDTNQLLSKRATLNGGVYLIAQANRNKDVGIYQCIAKNKLGSVLSNKANLTVAFMDQLKASYSSQIHVSQGSAAILKMPKMYDAYPAPTIEWFAGGALIEPNTKFAITKTFDLIVLKVDKGDEKSYYVEASSIHTGTKIRSKEMRLYVDTNSQQESTLFNSNGYSLYNNNNNNNDENENDLEFVVKPKDTVAKLNDNLVKFDCIVNSRTAPLDQIEITWYKDSILIDFIKTKYHLSARSLEIISVSDQDAGVYTCVAKFLSNIKINEKMSLNASAKLDVYIKPTFKTQPDNLIETDYGKTVELKCDGIANPIAVITWYKNAVKIDPSKEENIEIVESNTLLRINKISMKDQAIYQCFLDNEAGQISASSLIKIISFRPQFMETVTNKTVFSDSDVLLSCGQVNGSPKPLITWIRKDVNEDQIVPVINELSHNQNNKMFQTKDGNVLIKSVNSNDKGWYKCQAENILGRIEASIYLQVKKKTEIIEPPMNISATKGQSSLFKCGVSKEDDIDISLDWYFNGVHLDFSTDFNNYDNLNLFPNGSLQIKEAKNTDIGIYKCLVRSINNKEAGSDSSIAYLNVVELPYAPTAITAQLNDFNEKRSVNLTWTPTFDGNSDIVKYIIQGHVTASDVIPQWSFKVASWGGNVDNDWYVVKDNVEPIKSNDYSSKEQQQQQQQQQWTIIRDLKPAFSYQFRVSAVNGIGEGMPSRSSNEISLPEEVPASPPQNIQSIALDSTIIQVNNLIFKKQF
jgi:protein sidekick